MTVRQEANRTVKTIAVASGKGGVGKTNVVANLAIAMRRQGKNVLIVDADLGLSNIDVLLRLAPRHTIQHVLSGERSLKDVIIDGPQGIKILPAGQGVQELTMLDEAQRLKVLDEFDSYDGSIDVLLIDTAAGISENVSFFCTAAQEIVIVTSPEPTAITGAQALINVLFTRYQEKQFHVLVNSAENGAECVEVFKRLSQAVERYENISLNYLGCIPFDESVHLAVREQKAFVDLYPGAPASRQVAEIAARLVEHSGGRVKGSLQFFIGSLVSAATGAE